MIHKQDCECGWCDVVRAFQSLADAPGVPHCVAVGDFDCGGMPTDQIFEPSLHEQCGVLLPEEDE